MTNGDNEYKDMPPLVEEDGELDEEQPVDIPIGCLVMQKKFAARVNYDNICVQRKNIFYTR